MNLNEFTDLNDYMNFLNNLCIYIIYFYSIVLILDELYNIGIFTYNYTNNFNIGSATQQFNTINTIECETPRFNIYKNINFLKTDIFNNTYLNYLITVCITLLTIIACISYGIFFYYRIIHSNPVCAFDINDEVLLSLPKRILKCICDDCHKILPNCSINYLILMLIIIIIPLAYIIKLFLKIDYTPTNNIIMFILSITLFSYIYNIYMDNNEKETTIIIKEILIFVFFTIIFLLSIYIHKNIYDTYNDIDLNNNLTDTYVTFDMYKQAPPNKPSAVQLPIFNGDNLLKTFNYVDGGDINDVNYKEKKQLLEKYYNDVKEYEIAMREYQNKNDTYKISVEKQKIKLDDKVYFFDILFNILGIKNKFNIFLIVLIVILIALYYYFKDDLFLSSIIYLTNVLILITLIGAITYYNTYFNKYIIYEPCSYYKNDLTIANTKLNMILNSGNGTNFYNILNNSSDINYNTGNNLNKNNIINNIKSLTNISSFNYDNIKIIKESIDNYNSLNTTQTIAKNTEIDSIIYYKFNPLGTDKIQNPIKYLFTKINTFIINNTNIEKFKIINKLKFYFSNKTIEIPVNFSNYYGYLYYRIFHLQSLVLKLLGIITERSENNNLNNLYDIIDKILLTLKPFKSYVNVNTYTKKVQLPVILGQKIDTNISDIENKIKDIVNENTTILTSSAIKNIINQLLFNYYNNKTIIDFPLNYSSTDETGITIITGLGTNTDGTYLINFTNLNSNINNFILTQPYILSSPSSSTSFKYYEFPNKITDDNNNEVFCKFDSTAEPILISNIAIKTNSITNNSITSNYIIKSNYKYAKSNTYTINLKKDNPNIFYGNITTDFGVKSASGSELLPESSSISSSNFYIPSKIYKNDADDDNSSTTFKTILFNVMLNNLINITTKFDNIEMQKLFVNGETIKSDINIYNFNTLFTTTFSTSTSTTFITNITNTIENSTNILGYIIILFNIYNSNLDKLIPILEYLIYMRNSNPSNNKYNDMTIFSSDENLYKNLNKIETEIIKPKNEKDFIRNDYKNKNLIKYYERNKYLVSIIITIYKNLFTNIKTVISTIDKDNLCFSSNDKYTIEKNLYNHINKYYTLPALPLSSSSSIINIKTQFFNKENKNKILHMNEEIFNLFKIFDFLFENLVDGVKNISQDEDDIIKNFNFYNQNLYNNITDFINEKLTINCNYTNKYNNLEISKMELFKYNADNVAYNFPILMIIFLVVLGEGFFIKS